MTYEAAEREVARRRGISVEQMRAALDALAPAAPATPRLKWGKDNAPDENPAAFAWRAYQAEAKAGMLHRGVIAQEDKPLAVKLANWTAHAPDGPRGGVNSTDAGPSGTRASLPSWTAAN